MTVVIAAGVTETDLPRVGFERIAGTVAASTEAAGFAAVNADSFRTDSFWQPTTLPATWSIDAGSAVAASYAGIAAHDLGSVGATVILEHSPDDSTWTEVESVTPTEDSPILFLFEEVSRRYWRVRITGTDEPTVGVIAFGPVLMMPRLATYAPDTPLHRAVQTSYRINQTDGGQFVGRSVTRRSVAAQIAIEYLSDQFVEDVLPPFIAHAETAPFFLAPRPGSDPRNVGYVWTNGRIVPERAIPNAEITNTVTLDVTGSLT